MFKFWPFPVMRNYSTAPSLSRLFLEFESAPDLQILENDYHNVTVVCSKGTLHFWDSNRFYAWASSGSLTANGRTVHWSDEMPSRYAVRAMYQALVRVRFAVPGTEKEAA